METNGQQTAETLDAREFLGNYLRKEDIERPVVATLVDVRAEQVQGETKRKLVAAFSDIAKPLILNQENIKTLASLFGTHNASAWRGTVTVYVDPNVKYRNEAIGGIRIKAAAAGVANSSHPVAA